MYLRTYVYSATLSLLHTIDGNNIDRAHFLAPFDEGQVTLGGDINSKLQQYVPVLVRTYVPVRKGGNYKLFEILTPSLAPPSCWKSCPIDER
jgi:hypothetical protein